MRTARLSVLPAVDTRDLLRVAIDLSGSINEKTWLEVGDRDVVWWHAPQTLIFAGISYARGRPWVEANFSVPDPRLLSLGAYSVRDWEVLRQFLVLPAWPGEPARKVCTCPMPMLLAAGCQCGGE